METRRDATLSKTTSPEQVRVKDLVKDISKTAIGKLLSPSTIEALAEQIMEKGWTKTSYSDVRGSLPINGQTLRWADLLHDSESDRPERQTEIVTDADQANIVCSDRTNAWMREHNLILDIDYPVTVVESSPGKSHLYIDHAMEWEDIIAIMAVMVKAGLVQKGYMFTSIQQGYTSVRVPWALKGSGVRVPPPPAIDSNPIKAALANQKESDEDLEDLFG